MRSALPLVLVAFFSTTLHAQAPFPRIEANNNRNPAGVLKDGVLTLKLDIVRGMWFPDADSDPGTDIYAFAEAGHAPSIPAPLIRVPAGTEIRTTIHNPQTDSSFLVYGLSGNRTMADTVRILPGETRELITHATSPGTFLYGAETFYRTKRDGDDRMLAGAFVVDGPGEPTNDRVLVLLQWINEARLKETPGTVAELLTINGKAWPNTERLDYNFGDTIRWRVVNGSFDVHPMHLHGAYFTILARGDMTQDTLLAPSQRRQGVTEVIMPHTTMLMQWVPPHAGNWLFHCHLTFHVQPHPMLGDMKASENTAMAMPMGAPPMGGLTLGIRVHGAIAKDDRPRTHIRLVAQQFDSVPGDYGPHFAYSLGHEATAAHPSPAIIVHRNEPTSITVVNRLPEPTSVHWHGLEIESYYDGVHGFSGHDNVLAPPVAPNDSFVVQMTPPRAGTFIYHTHFDDLRQQGGGLYGAFIVLEPGKHWDPAHDVAIVMCEALDTVTATGEVVINGVKQPEFHFKAGNTYRIRLINITLAHPLMMVRFLADGKPLQWQVVARDGADLPAPRSGPATQRITDGQTYDVLWTAPRRGQYGFDIVNFAGKTINSGSIIVE